MVYDPNNVKIKRINLKGIQIENSCKINNSNNRAYMDCSNTEGKLSINNVFKKESAFVS